MRDANELALLRREQVAREQEVKRRLLEACGSSLTPGQVCTLMGVTTDVLQSLQERGEVCALTHGGEVRYPGWQWLGGRRLTGRTQVREAYPGNEDWSFVDFMVHPHPGLEQHRPLTLLEKLHDGKTMSVSRALGRPLCLEDVCEVARHDFEHGCS